MAAAVRFAAFRVFRALIEWSLEWGRHALIPNDLDVGRGTRRLGAQRLALDGASVELGVRTGRGERRFGAYCIAFCGALVELGARTGELHTHR